LARALAYVSGVALAPGVSRNNRLYTRETISRAVKRAQQRIAEGRRPIGMYTRHETTNTRELVGRVTRIWQEDDGSARYVAAIADTGTGRDIASLVNPEGEEPAFLRGVSIRGNWVGGSRRERGPDGGLVEAGSDLEIGRLDWTSEPGVDDAGVDSFRYADAGDGETGETFTISESAPEALLETVISEEATPPSPAIPAVPAVPEGIREALRGMLGTPGAVLEAGTPPLSKRDSGLKDDSGRPFADPGYQSDNKQRYDLSTAAHAKSAWSYINKPANQKFYSAAQLKRVKNRIRAALKKFGITPAAEGWCVDPAVEITEAIAEYAGMDPECAGSYSLSATNGPTTVTICSYQLDPADLCVILAQACKGASLALMSLDPDMDADIDVAGADAEDTDDDAAQVTSGDAIDSLVSRLAAAFRGESAEDPDAVIAEMRASAPAVTEAATDKEEPAPPAAAERQEETEAPVSESTTTTEAVAQAPAATFTQADVDGMIASALERAEAARRARKAAKRGAVAAPAESAAPAAAAVTETEDERIARIVAEKVAALTPAPVTETEDQRIARIVEAQMVIERQKITEQGGGPGRKGLSPSGEVNEHSGVKVGGEPGMNRFGLPMEWPDKPLHEFTGEELEQYANPVLVRHVLKDRADLIG